LSLDIGYALDDPENSSRSRRQNEVRKAPERIGSSTGISDCHRSPALRMDCVRIINLRRPQSQSLRQQFEPFRHDFPPQDFRPLE
jgi:hypothetical protein